MSGIARRALGLPRRGLLTLRYYGVRELVFRLLTFPLRPTRLGRRLGYGRRFGDQRAKARAWYREHGRPVTVVIPTYGNPELTARAVRSVRRTTRRRPVRIVVPDDGSAPEHRHRLRRLRGAEAVFGEETAGFAANVNRGLRAAGGEGDVVVLNNDVVAHRGWLECLQHRAYEGAGAGVVGPRLLYPDGRIQSAGSYRNLDAPEWFDHRYRFAPADHGPATVRAPVLAVTGACMYVTREALERLGPFDEGYPMAYEDVDLCLRAWEAGARVLYEPAASLTHLESPTRGTEVGERERASQRRFWSRWGGWFDGRDVRTPEGRLRAIYVTEDTGVGGGHRDVFEHLNRLARRGHAVELYSLDGPPDWFELEVPVRTFGSYRELSAELEKQDAIKVATWWNTALAVWLGSVRRGIPVYFVQDVETSYYEGWPAMQHQVLASYRQEFHYMTISRWNQDRLRELGLEARLIPPGIDLETFRPLDAERRPGLALAIGRANPLKNLDLTVDAWRALDSGAELWMFGVEPELGERHGARYVTRPTDTEVNELLNTASVFVQTSIHEGFCLPVLEAMATGTPVVCTDAHGNRDVCRDGVNCLMPEPTVEAVSAALERVLREPGLAERLAAEGRRTAAEYAWERRIDELEAYLGEIASRGSLTPYRGPAGADRSRSAASASGSTAASAG